MKTHNKMMIAVGALALTATTLLAGCGGSSTASTAASSPAAESPAPSSAAPESLAVESAAPESAAPEVPTSVTDGLVKPAGLSDEAWAGLEEVFSEIGEGLSSATQEEIQKACDDPTSLLDVDSEAKEMADAAGAGTVEEWTAVYSGLVKNVRLLACTMVE